MDEAEGDEAPGCDSGLSGCESRRSPHLRFRSRRVDIPACHVGGSGFKSRRNRHFGSHASVEKHPALNRETLGSSPRRSTNLGCTHLWRGTRLLSGKCRVRIPGDPPLSSSASRGVRRLVWDQEVLGSTPRRSTTLLRGGKDPTRAHNPGLASSILASATTHGLRPMTRRESEQSYARHVKGRVLGPLAVCSVRLAVRISGSLPEDRGSSPLRSTHDSQAHMAVAPGC